MQVPGCSQPSRQYGGGSWFGELADCLPDVEFTVLPDAEGAVKRSLDRTEITELGTWEKDGFTERTDESTT